MKSQRLACYRNLNMKFASGKDQIVLDNIAELSLSRNIPIVDLDVATLITVLLRMRKARQIIELGTGLGYSSLLFSLCCPTASVLTIDRDGDCCAIAQNMFDQSSAHSRIHIVNSDILKTLKSLDGCYDFVFIDSPPSLGLLTLNALVAADTILVPIQCEFYALEGVSQLLNTITLVKDGLNPDLHIEGVLMTMADFRTNLTNEVINEIKNYFKDKVYKSIIPRNIRLSEAPSFGKPINHYDAASAGSLKYKELAEEFLIANNN